MRLVSKSLHCCNSLLLALLVLGSSTPARADDCLEGRALPLPVTAAVREITLLGDILLEDGRRYRLAGLAWPETATARARLKAEVTALLGGERLIIAHAGAPDRWQRNPAQLFAARPAGQAPLWVQGDLIENGLAHPWPEAAARACRAALLERAMLARNGRLGLWSALHRRALKRLAGQADGRNMPLRIVYEARVRSVRRGRAVTFVNFAGPRPRTPALFLNAARMQEFQRQGRDPATFTGKHVRVFAETDGGTPPRLSIASAEHIEVLD